MSIEHSTCMHVSVCVRWSEQSRAHLCEIHITFFMCKGHTRFLCLCIPTERRRTNICSLYDLCFYLIWHIDIHTYSDSGGSSGWLAGWMEYHITPSHSGPKLTAYAKHKHSLIHEHTYTQAYALQPSRYFILGRVWVCVCACERQ